MDSSARIILVLMLTITSCALGQLDSQPPTQSISASGNAPRNNRNPISLLTITSPPPATTTTTATSSQATLLTTDTTIASQSLGPEQPKLQAQILTPLRNKTRPATTTTTPVVTSTTTAASTTTSTEASTPSAIEEEVDVDPEAEDLCIINFEDARRVNTVWQQSDRCGEECRCVFRSKPKDPKIDHLIRRTDNMKLNSEPTEIRCSLPQECSHILDKLVPTKACPMPAMLLTSPNPDSCDCPEVKCGLMPVSSSTIPAQRFSSQSSAYMTTTTTTTTTTPTPTIAATTTTTTTAPPPTTTTTTVLPPAVPTDLTPTTTSIVQESQLPTTTTSTTAAAATTAATKAATTVTAAAVDTTSATTPGDRSITTGEPRTQASSSGIIQAIDVGLEKYAAYLFIALALMTSLFLIVSFMYLRRAFRSSMVHISDCYENPGFTKRVVLIDETDQNFRNKNKEVDGYCGNYI